MIILGHIQACPTRFLAQKTFVILKTRWQKKKPFLAKRVPYTAYCTVRKSPDLGWDLSFAPEEQGRLAMSQAAVSSEEQAFLAGDTRITIEPKISLPSLSMISVRPAGPCSLPMLLPMQPLPLPAAVATPLATSSLSHTLALSLALSPHLYLSLSLDTPSSSQETTEAFRPPAPTEVPLWVAAYLKKRDKCRIRTPAWLEVEP